MADFDLRGADGLPVPHTNLLVYLTDTQKDAIHIYICGYPGVGKTSLLLSLLQESSRLPHHPQILYIDVEECFNARTWINLFKGSSHYQRMPDVQQTISYLANSDGTHCVIMLDHLEIDSLKNNHDSIVYKILLGKILPNASTITASRCSEISAVKKAFENRSPTAKCYILEGIKSGSENKLLHSMCLETKSERMSEYIKFNCPKLCTNPGMTMKLMKRFRENIPGTFTKMMESVIVELINNQVRESSYKPIASLLELTEEYSAHFSLVCKLAYILLFEGDTDTCGFNDFTTCTTLCGATVPAPKGTLGLGLLLEANLMEKDSYKFPHRMIQEFLAAYFIAMEPVMEQVRTFKTHEDGLTAYDGKLSNACKFYFGMSYLLNESSSSSSSSSKNIVCTPKTLLEKIGNQLRTDDKPKIRREKLLFIYQLLYECQDVNLVRKFLQRREKFLTLSLEASMLTEPLVRNLTYVVVNSGITKWSIQPSEESVHSAEYMAMLVRKESLRKIEVRIEEACGDVFSLRPLTKSVGQLKMYSDRSIFVRSMKEILQSILQLYSPIKLKSDSNEPSYISFLSCQCLRDKIEKEGLLVVQPIQAIHWIKVGPKKTNSKRTGKPSLPSEDDSHMTRHNMEHLEMVLMMSPLPNRIYYRDPMKEDLQPIELCRNSVPHYLDGRIASSIQKNLRDFELCDVVAETQPKTLLTEMVSLPLLIPRSDKGILDALVCTKHASYICKGFYYHDETLEKQALPTTTELEDNTNLPYSAMESHEYAGNGRTAKKIVQRPVQQSTEFSSTSAHKQVAVRPGTVLYTTAPHIYVKDQVYEVPPEGNMIKRGGNGEVYAITCSGVDYAAKKTAYRSREIQIHKKMKHPNVMELSFLMFGHKQPRQQKRYFCYHIMPRVTGDLARMVTDKPELTMESLSSKFIDDPLRLGSMQGNWKFILKEMLKGLSYMHQMNIVHRDLKASNILIKMFCRCDNPLTCTCQQKCQVKVSDYDAALELSSGGSLLPTPLSGTQGQNKHGNDVYHVIPAGTDGYRAPESSQLIISNDLSVLSPALTIKVDIWAVGLIVMRMLNGCSGPVRQKKLSTLLLYYEQEKAREKKSHFMRHHNPAKFTIVSKEEVDDIIGLSRFKSVSNSWILKAVDCISKCVNVDPNKRPTAGELLEHPFLF